MTDQVLKDFFATMNTGQVTPKALLDCMDSPELREAAKNEFIRMSHAPDKWFLEEFNLEDTPEHRAVIADFKNDLRQSLED